jgi:pyridinium-3,5-bisthiocarboxylic acid mononucleotide nickel chelatase
MKTAYFDCFSGISGDMTLGALVDAGCPFSALESELHKLPLGGWKLSCERVQRGSLAATRIHVQSDEHHCHRGFSAITEMISRAALLPRAALRATAIFTKLAEAEAKMHGLPVEDVRFHEVGAVDSIIDIVGAATGFELMGIERFACSPLNVGGGTVAGAHGTLPVPAPATAELLKGVPTYASGEAIEFVTPTGAAIVAALCDHFGPQPAMRAVQIGYGAGAANPPGRPNVLRITLGEAPAAETGPWAERITVIEANLDDMNPQIYGYFAERALAAGALDIFTTPVQMKKNRPGMLLTLLCAPPDAERLTDLLFAETTTIGVRRYEAQRRVLARENITLDTRFGAIHLKVARRNGHILNAAPEFDDCRRIAAERGVPLKEVMAEAAVAWEKLRASQSSYR